MVKAEKKCVHPRVQVALDIDSKVVTLVSRKGRSFSVVSQTRADQPQPLRVTVVCLVCSYRGQYLPGSEPGWARGYVQLAVNHMHLVENKVSTDMN
jgi:hypothetical protein